MGLYEPSIAKIRREEKREQRKAKREKYKIMYREELAKERAKLQAQKEKDIKLYKTKRAIEKAHARARARVKPFTPSTMFKMPSKHLTPEQKRKLKKAGVEIGKTTVSVGKSGLKLLEAMFNDKPAKRKPVKRKYIKKTTKRKYKKKTTKRKGKTYYCRKCKQRHSYTSKIGKKHR